jgi:hypothetical protein
MKPNQKEQNYKSALAQVAIAGASKEVILDILKNQGFTEKELESFDKDLIKYEEEFESYILYCKLNSINI